MTEQQALQNLKEHIDLLSETAGFAPISPVFTACVIPVGDRLRYVVVTPEGIVEPNDGADYCDQFAYFLGKPKDSVKNLKEFDGRNP